MACMTYAWPSCSDRLQVPIEMYTAVFQCHPLKWPVLCDFWFTTETETETMADLVCCTHACEGDRGVAQLLYTSHSWCTSAFYRPGIFLSWYGHKFGVGLRPITFLRGNGSRTRCKERTEWNSSRPLIRTNFAWNDADEHDRSGNSN